MSPSRSYTDDGDDQPETVTPSKDLPPRDNLKWLSINMSGLVDKSRGLKDDNCNDNHSHTSITTNSSCSRSGSRSDSGYRQWAFPESNHSCNPTSAPTVISMPSRNSNSNSNSNSYSSHTTFAACNSSTHTNISSNSNNNSSTHSNASISLKTHETKLSRSVERRKRIEGRFARERIVRRTLEDERDQVFGFVKGLLLGLEAEEQEQQKEKEKEPSISIRSTFDCSMDPDMEIDSISNRGRNMFQQSRDETTAPTKTLSSIRDFLLRYGQLQEQEQDQQEQDQNHRDLRESACYDSNSDWDTVDRDSSPRHSLHRDGEHVIGNGESAQKLRKLFESCNTNTLELEEEPQRPNEDEDDCSDDSDDEDTSEAEDEFPELPVKLRSIRELTRFQNEIEEDEEDTLMSDDDDDDVSDDDSDDEGDTSIHFSSHSRSDEEVEAIAEVIRERDLKHALELEWKAEELEALRGLLEESKQTHSAEISRMKLRHKDEISKRDKILERALCYCEQLEGHCTRDRRSSSSEKGKMAKDTALEEHRNTELREKESTIDLLHAEELKAMQDRHKTDLADLETKLQAKNNDDDLQNVQQALAVRDSRIEVYEQELAEKRGELQTVRESLELSTIRLELLERDETFRQEATEGVTAATVAATASSTRMVHELQKQLRERDVCIEELEEDLIHAMKRKEGQELNLRSVREVNSLGASEFKHDHDDLQQQLASNQESTTKMIREIIRKELRDCDVYTHEVEVELSSRHERSIFRDDDFPQQQEQAVVTTSQDISAATTVATAVASTTKTVREILRSELQDRDHDRKDRIQKPEDGISGRGEIERSKNLSFVLTRSLNLVSPGKSDEPTKAFSTTSSVLAV